MGTYPAWRASVLLGRIKLRAHKVAVATAEGCDASLLMRLLLDDLGDLEAELSELLDPRCGDGAARASDAARQSGREWRGL